MRSVPERQWERAVPVVTFQDRRPQYVTVAVLDGEVVVQGPPLYVLSPTGRDVLCEVVTEAHAFAQNMDQGLS